MSSTSAGAIPAPHLLPAPQNFPTTDSAVAGPWGVLTGVQILSTGAYAPPEVVTNADLARLGCDAQWILQRTGIRERRCAPPDVATSDLALQAARNCLAAAGVSPRELDLVLV